MNKMYVVSGMYRFSDLNDAIQFAKERLFEKVSRTNDDVTSFSMHAKTDNRIVIRTGLTNTWRGYKSKTVTIRVVDAKAPQLSLEAEYNRYKQNKIGK